MENPIAPAERNAAPATDNPFAPPPDSTKSPMSNVNDGPMNDDGANKESQGATEPSQATDNPFAEPASPRLSAAAPAYEAADTMRVWTDVTGKHQVRGQMKRILVAEQKVRILKDTGKYTTVPFARLSEADRTFVAHYAAEPSALLAQGQ
jgi:hypothetical protein